MTDETITTKLLLEGEDRTGETFDQAQRRLANMVRAYAQLVNAVKASDRAEIEGNKEKTLSIEKYNRTVKDANELWNRAEELRKQQDNTRREQAKREEEKHAKHTEEQSKKQVKAWGDVSGALSEYVGRFTSVVGASEAIRRSFLAFGDAQRDFGRLQFAVKATADEIHKWEAQVRGISARTGQEIDGLNESFRKFSTMSGLSFNESRKAFESIVDAAHVAGVGVDDFSAAAVAALRNLKVPLGEVQGVVRQWATTMPPEMLKAFTGALPEISKELERVGIKGKSVSLELAAVFNQAGNALKTPQEAAQALTAIFTNMTSLSSVLGRHMLPEMQAFKSGTLDTVGVIASLDAKLRSMGAYAQTPEAQQIRKVMGVTDDQVALIKQLGENLGKVREELGKSTEHADAFQKRLDEMGKDAKAGVDRLTASFKVLTEQSGAAVDAIGGTNAINSLSHALELYSKLQNVPGVGILSGMATSAAMPFTAPFAAGAGIKAGAKGLGVTWGGLFGGSDAPPGTPQMPSTGGVPFLGKYAEGGAFTVPGAGGVDTQPVGFMATPGERVAIATPTQESLQQQQDKADIAQREHFARFHATAFTRLQAAPWWRGDPGKDQAGGGGGGGGGGGDPARGTRGAGGLGGSGRPGGSTGDTTGDNKGANDPPNTGPAAPPPSWPEVQGPPQPPSRWHRSGQGPTQPPGGPAPGAGDTGGPIPPLTTDARGNVNKIALQAHLEGVIASSGLNGYVPHDGPKWGINTGSPKEWAAFMTKLSGNESSFNVRTAGDHGKSHGLFQLSPPDAQSYHLQKTPFTMDQLHDPKANVQAAVSIMNTRVRAGGIMGKEGAQKYWAHGSTFRTISQADLLTGSGKSAAPPGVASDSGYVGVGGYNFMGSDRARAMGMGDVGHGSAEAQQRFATGIKSGGPASIVANKYAGPDIAGFLYDLHSAGAPLKDFNGVYVNKKLQHGYGNAVDIETGFGSGPGNSPGLYKWSQEHPKEFAEIQAKHHMRNLDTSSGASIHDWGHFEWSPQRKATPEEMAARKAGATTQVAGPGAPTGTPAAAKPSGLISGDKRPGVTFPPGTSAATIAAHQKAVAAKAGGGRSELAAQRWTKRRTDAAGTTPGESRAAGKGSRPVHPAGESKAAGKNLGGGSAKPSAAGVKDPVKPAPVAEGAKPVARALGGPVDAGGVYTVGERGPETLVAGMSGGIIPAGGGGVDFSRALSSYQEFADRVSQPLSQRRLGPGRSAPDRRVAQQDSRDKYRADRHLAHGDIGFV